MWKNSLISLTVIISFSGCFCEPEIVYLKPQYPSLEVPIKRSSIDVNVTNGCICGTSKDNVFNLVTQLRSTENYCIEQMTKVNSDFNSTKEK